jgi:serine phosphatase RsbU (regulator of sigma subunit)
MGKTQPTDDVEALERFTDVVYLSDKARLPSEIKRLFRQKKVSFCLLPFEKHHLIRRRADLVGTVLVDAAGIDAAQDQKLARILEALERDNLGIILLTQRVEGPARSFSLAAAQNSRSPAGTDASTSLDDLWAHISVNLAGRKQRNSGIASKPAASVSTAERVQTDRPESAPQAQEALMDSLKEQLRLAGLVQRDFLPDRLPNSSEIQWAVTFQPAEWVSGDIYDVARIDEQHIGFYVADAVGHSMPAALLTIFIKQALVMRQTTDNNYRIFGPVEVVKNLNLRMTGQKLSGYQFATCCYCLLNTRTRQLTFARAGHPYPILLRAGHPPQQLETRGSLLGIFENAEFTQDTIQLQSGDRLLLYSDGAEPLIGSLVDDKAGFRFTQEFLALQDASITEIVDRLTELAARRETTPAEVDDQTIVGLQIR